MRITAIASVAALSLALGFGSAFASTPTVMSDSQLDAVTAGGLGGSLTGTLILPSGDILANGETVDVADGLIGAGTIDTTQHSAATASGGITSYPPAP